MIAGELMETDVFLDMTDPNNPVMYEAKRLFTIGGIVNIWLDDAPVGQNCRKLELPASTPVQIITRLSEQEREAYEAKWRSERQGFVMNLLGACADDVED